MAFERTERDLRRLAAHDVLTYDLVAVELRISKHEACDVVLDLERDGLVRLNEPARHVRSESGRRRCVSPAMFTWVE